eukprot:12868793-Heterocapsa_arctica.AAC.1
MEYRDHQAYRTLDTREEAKAHRADKATHDENGQKLRLIGIAHERSFTTKAGKYEEESAATQAEKAEEHLHFKSME